jgi:hypothetical protein
VADLAAPGRITVRNPRPPAGNVESAPAVRGDVIDGKNWRREGVQVYQNPVHQLQTVDNIGACQ